MCITTMIVNIENIFFGENAFFGEKFHETFFRENFHEKACFW